MRITARLLRVFGPVILLTFDAAAANNAPFLSNLNNIKTIGSTVPRNGDINPYGVAIVPNTTGALVSGDVLISNFNNAANNQGTGTTIDQIGPNGEVKTFAQLNGSLPGPCPGGVGLTTALVALRSGYVIVGSLPTSDGSAATAKAGCLIVIDHDGRPIATLSGNGINGPWDMTAIDYGGFAVLFVTNVLNDTVAAGGSNVFKGTVLRIALSTPPFGTPQEISRTVIADGFGERTDSAALVIGPTGVGFGLDGRLYVADTVGNRIMAIPNALFRTDSVGTGTMVFANGALNGPLGLAIAPNGDILTVNGGDGNIVEITPAGMQAAVLPIDVSKQGGGTLFGLAIAPNQHGVYFVDDGNNTLNLLH